MDGPAANAVGGEVDETERDNVEAGQSCGEVAAMDVAVRVGAGGAVILADAPEFGVGFADAQPNGRRRSVDFPVGEFTAGGSGGRDHAHMNPGTEGGCAFFGRWGGGSYDERMARRP